jgi:hypothetical protein
MVGKRLRLGDGEVKLTCDKFPNRMENRKYVILQLENLLAETKRLNRESSDVDMFGEEGAASLRTAAAKEAAAAKTAAAAAESVRA